jgi:hypothetical protein
MWKIGLVPHAPTAPLEPTREPMSRTLLPRGLAAMRHGLEPDPRIDPSPQIPDDAAVASADTSHALSATTGVPLQSRATESVSGRPAAIVLFGKRHPIKSHAGGLVRLAEALHEQDPDGFSRLLALRGRKNAFVSQDPEEVFRPVQVRQSGYFVNVNLSVADIKRMAGLMLRRLGYRDSDFGFRYD